MNDSLQQHDSPRQGVPVSSALPFWEKTQDLVDQFIDISLNFRQSGHPGGSRSKVHILLALMLSGTMTYDLRDPSKRFNDRFILSAGHTVPLVYSALAILDEALRCQHQRTGDARFQVKADLVYPEDLVFLRRRGGLPGHAEFSGKTLFLKFNTGPSGHGFPAAVGEAFALARAGCRQVRVFSLEGDVALTPGAVHESKNSAWALGLENLFLLIDWNDFGIDDHRLSETVHGTPVDWFAPYGWRVEGTDQGSHFPSVAEVLKRLVEGENPQRVPSIGWFKTRKGRGYGVYDNKSHGSPHPPNSPAYWETKRSFQEKYGVQFAGFGEPPPEQEEDFRRQTLDNLLIVGDVLRQDENLCRYLAETLADLGDRVPLEIPSCQVRRGRNPYQDPRLFDFTRYPFELFAKPGEKTPNRAALAKFGAWANAFGAKEYNRPLFIACSADLAESTSIAGFAKKWGDFNGYGAFRSDTNPQGVLLPQEITEFANAGIMVGLATVNLAEDPFREFDGFWGACSTYGSFAYLKYGMMRLFSQLEQDCPLQVGKVIWVAGHSGPETADDSRTHFGIFEPGVTQLFPKGRVLNLHPWEHNEVPVVLGAALATEVPIIILHLTRPPIAIPDREKLGLPSHFEAARGAYLLRDFDPASAPMGTVIVQGTSTTDGVIRCLPLLERAAAGFQAAGQQVMGPQEGLNVRIVAAISYELFQRQDTAYRETILPWAGWLDSMVITSEALANMNEWISSAVARDYSLSSDWDNRWRSGGKLEEVLDEAHLTQPYLMAAIERFVRERPQRLARLRAASL